MMDKNASIWCQEIYLESYIKLLTFWDINENTD